MAIYIKPPHRGRLTKLKKRTGKTEAELYKTGSPAVRKMITFARNARKWKHAEGGKIANILNFSADEDAIKDLGIFNIKNNMYTNNLIRIKRITRHQNGGNLKNPAQDTSHLNNAKTVFDNGNFEWYTDEDMLSNRQRYIESKFNDRAVNSKSKATGAYQITPITYKDYLVRGKGAKGDLMDPVYNKQVRDWALTQIPKDLGSLYSGKEDEVIRLAKLYGAYNWGAGNMRKFLRDAKNRGVNIDSDLSWIDQIPAKETRNYIKFIVMNQDIPGSTDSTNSAYEAALANFKKAK